MFAMARRSDDVEFKLKAIAAVKGGSKQVRSPVQNRHKASKRVVFGSRSKLLADVEHPNCLVDVVSPDKPGEREHR